MKLPLLIIAVTILGSVIGLMLSHLIYALGWHDDMQLAALYGFGVFVGATTLYAVAKLED